MKIQNQKFNRNLVFASVAFPLLLVGAGIAEAKPSKSGRPFYVVTCNDERGEVVFSGAALSSLPLPSGEFEKPRLLELKTPITKKPGAVIPRNVILNVLGIEKPECKGKYLYLYSKASAPLSLTCASGLIKPISDSPDSVFEEFGLQQTQRDCAVIITAEQIRLLTRD